MSPHQNCGLRAGAGWGAGRVVQKRFLSVPEPAPRFLEAFESEAVPNRNRRDPKGAPVHPDGLPKISSGTAYFEAKRGEARSPESLDC